MTHEQEPRELRLDEFGNADPSEFIDAADAASDQDTATWIVGPGGNRVAAIVPVDVRKYHDQMIDRVLRTPVTGDQRARYRAVVVKLNAAGIYPDAENAMALSLPDWERLVALLSVGPAS
jgi:hypothetical protein